jgi:hypothetical protein
LDLSYRHRTVMCGGAVVPHTVTQTNYASSSNRLNVLIKQQRRARACRAPTPCFPALLFFLWRPPMLRPLVHHLFIVADNPTFIGRPRASAMHSAACDAGPTRTHEGARPESVRYLLFVATRVQRLLLCGCGQTGATQRGVTRSRKRPHRRTAAK